MFYIPQIQKDDCGFACLKMALATINKDKNYLFLPQDEKHGPYSFSDLIEIGEKYGLYFSAYRTSEKQELSNSSIFPFIASITLKNGGKHAVLVLKVKWKRVTYLDPAEGKVTVSIKKFASIWDGKCLFPERVVKQKCELTNLEPIKMWQKVLLGVAQLVAGVFTVLGIYFVKDGTPIYMPLIFLSLALLSELCLKIISYSLMKKIDQFFFDESHVPYVSYGEYLNRYENYKKYSLSSPMNHLLTLIFTVGLATIVILNDYRNLMIVLVPIVLTFIQALFITPLEHKKEKELEVLENDVNGAVSQDDFKEKVQKIHKGAYQFSYIDLIKRYCFALLMIVAVFLTMKLCDISSLPYIIFYTCISLALYKGMEKLFAFPKRMEEYNKVKVKISNSLKNGD